MNKLVIIQARMTSSRLPGKVLLDIGGKPMLQRMLERVRQASSIDGILLATTTDPSDDILAQFSQVQGLSCYRGSLPDVLDRYYQAAAQYHAEVIIRLTADCPLIDPQVIDLTIASFLGTTHIPGPVPDTLVPVPQLPDSQLPDTQLPDYQSLGPVDFAANRLPPPWKRTLPIGLDVEVCSFAALEQAWRESRALYQREHVMPYLYEGLVLSHPRIPTGTGWYLQHGTTPRGFKVVLLNHDPDYGSLRWTVDTRADLEFVRQVYARFEGESHFSWLDVLRLLEKEPELVSINAEVSHKSAFDVDQRSISS